MECPHCKNENTEVKDSRPNEIYDSSTVRRRRQCTRCFARFTTYELTLTQINQAKLSAAKTEAEKIIKVAINTAIRDIFEETLQEDTAAIEPRADTANRAHKTRFTPKIPDTLIIS